MKRYLFVLLALLFLPWACKEKTSYKQEFDNYFDKNVQACMKPFLIRGVDSAASKEVCECVLNKLFELDSTAFSSQLDTARMNVFNELVNKHMDEFQKCMEGIEQPVGEPKEQE